MTLAELLQREPEQARNGVSRDMAVCTGKWDDDGNRGDGKLFKKDRLNHFCCSLGLLR